MSTNPPLRLAAIGCGARSRTYLGLASKLPHLYSVVGAADPLPVRIERLRAACGNPPDFLAFPHDRALLAHEKFADVVVIGTQDTHHFGACLEAMERGYDILLEKPIATRLEEVLFLARRAEELGRRVLVCHVLRYTPFYRKVKEIIDSCALGEIISLNATEGVNPWHQAHSFVRGHWAVTEKSSPMIVAKSCHDMDIIAWLVGQPARSVSSKGGLRHFTAANAPAGAPERCTSGCPAGETCHYNALKYAGKNQRIWMDGIWDGHADSSAEEVVTWLKTSPWGRCVYRCDNTAVDHQVVAMEFVDGSTGTFTMTAFDSGRNIEIFGTRGVLRGGEAVKEATGAEITVRLHHESAVQRIPVQVLEGGYAGHGGGDMGLMMTLHQEMQSASISGMSPSIASSVESHILGFAAEASRVSGRTIDLPEFVARHRGLTPHSLSSV